MAIYPVHERLFFAPYTERMCSQPIPRPRVYYDEPSSYAIPQSHRRESSHPARPRNLSPRRVHFAPTPALSNIPHSSTMSPRPRSPRSILRSPLQPPPTQIPPPPPPPPPLLFPPIHTPTLPTVYILTYATSLTPNLPSFLSLLRSQLPHRTPPIKHLYTINAAIFPPPPRRMCEQYSGIAPVVQECVVRDAPARVAVQRAVEEILAFGEREREKGIGWKEGRNGERCRGEMEVTLSVCCVAGTHRSVAVGERIAQGVREAVRRRGGGEGVWVVVRHVHRVRGVGDPF